MADAGITKMAKRMVDRLKKAEVRQKVQASKGQIFIWLRKDFEKYMAQQGVSKEDVEILVALWRQKLSRQDKTQMNQK